MRDSGEVKGFTHFRRYNQNKLGELEGLKVHVVQFLNQRDPLF